MPFELFYWDGLQGRGEFIRLALEDAGAEYVDVVREPASKGLGQPAMMRMLDGKGLSKPSALPFAPPFLKDGDFVISQVANILMYLGPKLSLSPETEALRYVANGLQLTIADVVSEVHDTHHPVASGLYYEDQKEAAKQRSSDFLKNRVPKFLNYFERVLKNNAAAGRCAVGEKTTYVDLSLFQLIAGLHYAFPRAMKCFSKSYPLLATLFVEIPQRQNLARYLASDRRLAFNQSGIFRHYPELDSDG